MELEDLLAETEGTELGEILQLWVSGDFPSYNLKPMGEGEEYFAETTRLEKAFIAWINNLGLEKVRISLPSLLNLTYVEKPSQETCRLKQKRDLFHTVLWITIMKRVGLKAGNLGIRSDYQLVTLPENGSKRYTMDHYMVNIHFGLGGEIV